MKGNQNSSKGSKYEAEPEFAAVVGNLLVQPPVPVGDRSASFLHAVPPKETLGPYRLIASLGVGGMGTVYFVEHQRLKRQVQSSYYLAISSLVPVGWIDSIER